MESLRLWARARAHVCVLERALIVHTQVTGAPFASNAISTQHSSAEHCSRVYMLSICQGCSVGTTTHTHTNAVKSTNRN